MTLFASKFLRMNLIIVVTVVEPREEAQTTYMVAFPLYVNLSTMLRVEKFPYSRQNTKCITLANLPANNDFWFKSPG